MPNTKSFAPKQDEYGNTSGTLTTLYLPFHPSVQGSLSCRLLHARPSCFCGKKKSRNPRQNIYVHHT